MIFKVPLPPSFSLNELPLCNKNERRRYSPKEKVLSRKAVKIVWGYPPTPCFQAPIFQRDCRSSALLTNCSETGW